MADSFVQLPTDGVGKRINAFTGTDGDYNQAVVIVDSTGAEKATSGNPLFAQLVAGTASLGTVILGAGGAAIGTVSVTAISAGTNLIGTVGPQPSATGTVSSVAFSITAVTILASNAARKGAIIYNDSVLSLYLRYGAAASTTAFTYKLGPGQTLEVAAFPNYTGIITGIWDPAAISGNARVTELTV